VVAREVVSIAVNEVEEAATSAPLQHYHQICTFTWEKKIFFFEKIIYTGAHEGPDILRLCPVSIQALLGLCGRY
jgi:hypothetical protein